MESLALIRAIRGAPLTVLVTLTMSGQPLGTLQLATFTGYSDKTVTSALLTLQELGLVQRHGRYQAWLPTPQVHHLLGAGPLESEIPRLPESSWGGGSKDPDPQEQETTTTRDRTGEKDGSVAAVERGSIQKGEGRLPAEWAELAELLVERCATPRAVAHRALARALADGYYPVYIRYAILRWLAYCLSEQGRSIKNRGAFIASRIAQGLEPPDWLIDPQGELGREIRRARIAWESQEEE